MYTVYTSFNIYLHVLIFSKPQLARKDCEEAPHRSIEQQGGQVLRQVSHGSHGSVERLRQIPIVNSHISLDVGKL